MLQEATGKDDGGPGVSVRLTWDRDLRFRGRAGKWVTEIDGNGTFAPSPMQLLLEVVGSCAGVDMVDILRKGRHEVRTLTVRVDGDRRKEPPRRYRNLRVHFHVTGDVDPEAAERAARLSFEKYCSCFHSLRDDLELDYRVDVNAE